MNATILNLAAAAQFFSIGATSTLLSCLGGRRASAELAAGRAIRRMIYVGDHVVVAGQSGTVAKLHPAAIELVLDDGTTTLVPHSLVLDGPVSRRRAGD